MTIKDCIDLVDNQKPNQYTIKEKVMWLSFIDEIIINEVLKTHEGYDGRYDDFKGYTEDKLSVVLIVPSPYDRLYPAYLKMKIDGENGETARYNSSSALYNSYMLEFRKHYNKTHLPINSGIKKPIKYPTTTNAGLSDAELDNLKKELTFILTEYFSNTISDDKVYGVVNNFVQNNIQMLKGKDGEPGKDGQDATTPILGVDYFTKADKEQIVSEVANAVKVPKKISELIDDTNEKFISMAETAMVAGRAYKDGLDRQLDETYATKDSIPTKISDLVDNSEKEFPINYAAEAIHASEADNAAFALYSDYATQAVHDGEGNIIRNTYATKSEVGNIETALDGIIAIQNQLMGVSE